MDTRTFKRAMIYPDKDIGLTFLQGNRGRRIRPPHFIGCLGDDRPIVGFGTVQMAHPLRRLQAVCTHQPTHPLSGGTNPFETQFRLHLAVTFPLKRGGGQAPADVVHQRSVRTGPQRSPLGRRAGARAPVAVGLHPMGIHRRAWHLPNPAAPLQAVALMGGDRVDCTHGFDRRAGKGCSPSNRSILCSSRSLVMVNSPTLAWSCLICSGGFVVDTELQPGLARA